MPFDDDPAPLFRLYWENSSLTVRHGPAFAAQLDEDARRPHQLPQLFFASEDLSLPVPRDALYQVQSGRRSLRRFAQRPLTSRQLGSLFAAFSAHPDGRRLLPSGGGKFPVEVFALLFTAPSDPAVPGLERQAVYYNCDRHSLSRVGPCPSFEELAEDLGVLSIEAAPPAACFLFAIFPSRTTQKYGERGGRFALMEVGHYAQNLGLRLVQERLAGYELGGVRDVRLKRLLGLEETEAMIALGYLVGPEAS